MIIGAVTALAREARLVRRCAARTNTTSAVMVVAGGIGPERATISATALVERGAAVLLSTGYAGGLDAGVEVGDLLIPDTVVSEEGVACSICAPVRDRVHATLSGTATRHGGTLMCCARVLVSVEEKRAAALATGASGVDMESAAVAAVGCRFGVPVLVLRSVSDGAGRALPRAALASVRGDGRVSFTGVLGALARRPWELPALLRVARDVGAADETLGTALMQVLPLLVGMPPVAGPTGRS